MQGDLLMARKAIRFLRRGVHRASSIVLLHRASKAESRCANSVRELQRAFDAQYATNQEHVQRIAGESTMVVLGVAPFVNVSMLVHALARERIVLGELVIVDATAETLPGAAIHPLLANWGLRLPRTRLNVVKYSGQDVKFAGAMELGAQASQGAYLWFAGRDYIPFAHGFEYLLKACVCSDAKSVVKSRSMMPDGTAVPIEPTAIRSDFDGNDDRANGQHAVPHELSPRPAPMSESERPVLETCTSFHTGIFGGAKQLVMQARDGTLFDQRFITGVAATDLGMRLRARGIELLTCPASVARCLRQHDLDGAAPWEDEHDARWLREKHAALRKPERLEIVCPFHRGDVVLATQVAAHIRKHGRAVRLHVAAGLERWARDFDPLLDVQSVPVPVAAAQDTYPQLLNAFAFVSRRADASPNMARCHPARSLSETGKNLLDYVIAEAGLPPDTRLINIKPMPDDNDRAIARELVAPFGTEVIFVHPFGGWELKSIPPTLMQELVRRAHAAGFKLVQMGGAADLRVDAFDGAILENFLPTRWRAILELGHALIGVDSWTAHFASILDIPQVTMFGATHPDHVRTKEYFVDQGNRALALGPIVNCSPCNSLTCLAYPGASHCAGFTLDATFDTFLGTLRK